MYVCMYVCMYACMCKVVDIYLYIVVQVPKRGRLTSC